MIIIFPGGFSQFVGEIYCLPAIQTKDGKFIEAVKLGTPRVSKDERLAFSHNFHELQLEWLAIYFPMIEIVKELPKDWEDRDDEDFVPTIDNLELIEEKPRTEYLLEPDDLKAWVRPTTRAAQLEDREARKRQWQSQLPNK